MVPLNESPARLLRRGTPLTCGRGGRFSRLRLCFFSIGFRLGLGLARFLFRCFGLLRLLARHRAVFGHELLDAAFCVDELLLAGEERVARRADFDVELFERRARLERVAARADDGGLIPLGMDLLFHWITFRSAARRMLRRQSCPAIRHVRRTPFYHRQRVWSRPASPYR